MTHEQIKKTTENLYGISKLLAIEAFMSSDQEDSATLFDASHLIDAVIVKLRQVNVE